MAKTILIFPLALTLAASLLANPQDPSVQSGSVSCTSSNNLMEIRASDGAVIHWQDFSIQPNEVTRFIQPGETAKVLNRVMGSNASSLLGSLEANGQVFLINRNGILIGKDARIDTNGLFVSTYDLNNEDFMNGGEWNLRGSGGTIVHYGTIQAGDGDVYLIAQKIENRGSIEGGAIRMASAPEILICPEGNEKIIIRPSAGAFAGSIDDSGYLKAAEIELRASANPYSWAIRHTGEAQAKTIVASNGRIFLRTEGQAQIDGTLAADSVSVLADAIEVLPNAKIDVTSVKNGGSVQIGKKGRTRYVRVDKGAEIFADGVKGGNVLVWGDDVMAFNGSISARGTEEGGFVELSSAHFLMPSGFVDTRGPIMGKLLLDPSDVTIALANSNLGPFLPPPTPPPSPPVTNYSFSASPATILNTDLQNFLATTNVVINTANGVGGPGDITVSAGVNWSSGFSLYLEASQDLIINNLISCSGGGGVVFTATRDITLDAGAIPVGVSLNSGSISADAGRSFTVTGGTAANASAILNSNSGTISVSSVQNMTLTGGNSSNTPAEIASLQNDVTVSRVGGDLTLQGGSGSQAYASIGKGAMSVATAITSDITVENITGNININGGNAAGAYAQIGHSPFGIVAATSVQGDINLPQPLVLGNVTLTGGGSANATAIIGHGNELSTQLINVVSNIDIRPLGTITLNGGTGNFSHAIIGFCSPNGGSTSTFTVNSSLFHIETLVGADINLQAGTGSNAVIGYYNSTLVGGVGVNLTISEFDVKTQPTQQIVLLGGNTGGIGEGVAAIGTLTSSGTAVSQISLTSGGLSLTGSNASDGSAQLVNSMPGTSSNAFDLIINLTGLGTMNLMGGSASINSFAEIYCGNQLIMNYQGALTVNNTLQQGAAKIVALNETILNNSLSATSITLAGGANATAEALIQCLAGPVQIGGNTIGGTSLQVGSATSQAPSRIISDSGTSTINIGGPLTIRGGLTGSKAQIGQTDGSTNSLSLSLQTGTFLQVLGGTGNGAFAEIGINSGSASIFVNTFLSLLAGSATNTYAQIGRGILTTPIAINSNISFTHIGGNVTLTAGSASGAYAQIGHSPTQVITGVTAQGNITFPDAGAQGQINLTGGSVVGTTAIIGHGNELTSFLQSATGNITVFCSSNINLNAGSAANTHAIIGFHNPYAGSSVVFTALAPSAVTVNNSNAPIVLTATNASNAIIGYYNGATPSAVSVTLNQVNVQEMGNQNITLFAGNNGGTGAGIAAIGIYANAGTGQGNVNVMGGTVLLQGPTAGNGAARIINNNNISQVSADYDIQIQSTNLRLLGGTGSAAGFADIYTSRNLQVINTNILDVNNDAVPQLGFAQIQGYSNISFNPFGGGGVASLTGGTMSTSYSLIESLHGNLSMGPVSGSGASNLFINQSTSLAPAQIVAHSDFIYLGALNQITLQGGAAVNAVARVKNTSGSITVQASTALSLTGGTGATDAPAEIVNQSGAISFQSGSNTTLQGGGTARCWARISSDTGSITGNLVGVNLNINGGTAADCFAQIGKGYDTTIAIVNSDITLNSVGQDIILQGGSASNCYAQIGHSPYAGATTVSVSGNLSILSTGGKINLNGGSGSDTTAIIGHGNELTNLVNLIVGSVSVSASGSGGITFQTGTGTLTHTTIGAHSPTAGTLAGLNCSLSLVSVSSFGGPITLNGGDKLNAIIGYYNATTAPTITTTISQINVITPVVDSVVNSVVLQAGNNVASNCGVAAIGTYAPNLSTASSNITVRCGQLFVLGPTGINDSSAVILNNRPNIASASNVSVSTMRTTIRGNTGSVNGFAKIYSSQNLTLDFQKALNVNIDPSSPATLQHANATIVATKNIVINPSFHAADLTMLGGNAVGVLSDIESIGGNITIGSYPHIAGLNNVTIGRSDMIGATRFFASDGLIQGVGMVNLALNGGAGIGALAEINANKDLKLSFNGGIALTSGAGAGSLTRLIGNNGDLFIQSLGLISLTGDDPATIQNLGGTNGLLSVQTLQDLVMNLDSEIINSGNGSTNIGAGGNFTLNQNALVQNTGTGSLIMFAGINGSFLNTSSARSGAGGLTVVVDNLYPTPPGIGTGSFVLASGASLISGAKIQVFTAKRSQNQVSGEMNFVTFVPGTEFLNSATEQWNTYYPSSFGGVPYTIFYKDGPSNPSSNPIANLIDQFLTASFEFLQNLKTYDDFLYTSAPFTADLETYPFIRRYYRNYNTKLIDPLK